MSSGTNNIFAGEVGADVADVVDVGTIFADTAQGDETLYRVVYLDDSRLLARPNKLLERTNNRHYRYCLRSEFNAYVREGRYELREESADAPAMPSEVNAEEIGWSDAPGVGEKTEQKLNKLL